MELYYNKELSTNKALAKERLHFVDISKGFVIFLCVLGHAVVFQGITFTYIFSFHMPFFFLISGYCKQNGNANEKFLYSIKKWLLKLLVPSFIFKIVRFWNPQEMLEWLKTIFLDPSAEWFLTTMFFANILFFIFKKFDLKSNNRYLKLGVAALFIFFPSLFCKWFLYVNMHMKEGLLFSVDVVLLAFSFMLIGYYLHKYVRKYSFPKTSMPLCIFIVVVFALFAKFILVNSYVNISNSMLGSSDTFTYFAATFISATVVFLSYNMEIAGAKNHFLNGVNKLLELWGRNSLWIYLCHIIMFDEYSAYLTAHSITVNHYLQVAFYVIVTMLILTPIFLIIEKIKKGAKQKKTQAQA